MIVCYINIGTQSEQALQVLSTEMQSCQHIVKMRLWESMVARAKWEMFSEFLEKPCASDKFCGSQWLLKVITDCRTSFQISMND